MTRTITSALAVIAIGLIPATNCFAQDGKAPAVSASPSATEDSRSAEYERAVHDLPRVEGPFPLYLRKRDLLLEIPESRLGKPFLIQAAFETGLDTGLLHAGMSIGDQAIDAFQWERQDDVINLVRPNINNRWDADNSFAVGAKRTFPKAILGGFRIEQYDPARHLILINVTQMFYGDLFYLPQMVAGVLGGPYMMDRERSVVDTVKGFDDSTMVRMRLHFVSPRGAEASPLAGLLGFGSENTLEDDRSAPVKVTYSMWYRDADGYVPRVADPRIGYFTQDFFSLDRYLDRDRIERYINRFNIQKKDPKAPMSDPIKPIVWTIDPSIPPKYRDAVKVGILRWNKGFEAIGISNAIQVVDAPRNGGYDHADGRRNVIRMSVGPSSPFAAISMPRTDPFTGEILNASITLDGNLVRDMFTEHDSTEMSAAKSSLKKAKSILLRDEARTETDDHFLYASDKSRALEANEQKLEKLGWRNYACDYAEELGDEAQLNWYAIEATGVGISREQYVQNFISDCVCHEVGHCLGLRHNFAGSTNLSTTQLADDALTSKQGVSASVMDYTPPNVQAVLKGHGNFYSPTIGEYDKWAIRYGYSASGASSPDAERSFLAGIARQSGLPGHAYMTDEDADSFNPYAVRFDLGSDPLAFSALELKALRRARNFAVQHLPEPGQSYRTRTEVVLSSIVRSFREGRNAARFVGGMEASRNFKGDAGEKPTLAPVDSASQRTAMSLIAGEFLSPSSFDLPSNILSSLTFGDDSPTWTAPLRDLIGAYQQALVATVMSARTTDRIAENSYKVGGKGSYGLDEHYGLLLGAVFREVGGGTPIAPLRRDLQRFVLSGLMLQAGAPEGAVSDDVRMIANDSLRRLSQRMAQAGTRPNLDGFTKVYLSDSQEEIRRFMARLSTTR